SDLGMAVTPGSDPQNCANNDAAASYPRHVKAVCRGQEEARSLVSISGEHALRIILPAGPSRDLAADAPQVRRGADEQLAVRTRRGGVALLADRGLTHDLELGAGLEHEHLSVVGEAVD